MVRDFVCLMGIDGSGKTTQARRLVDRLNRTGFPARYVWCRWRPFLMKPFQIAGRAILRRRAVTPADYARFTGSKQRILKQGLMGSLWLSASLLDYYLVQVFPRVVLSRARRKALVCDRYLYDTLIDQGINLGLSPEEGPSLLCSLPARIFPRPSQVILLDVDPGIAYQRKTDVADPEYLVDRRQRYLCFAEHLRAAVIDASASPEIVEREIAAALGLAS